MPNLRQPSRLVVFNRSSMWKNGTGDEECVSGWIGRVDSTGLVSGLAQTERVHVLTEHGSDCQRTSIWRPVRLGRVGFGQDARVWSFAGCQRGATTHCGGHCPPGEPFV